MNNAANDDGCGNNDSDRKLPAQHDRMSSIPKGDDNEEDGIDPSSLFFHAKEVTDELLAFFVDDSNYDDEGQREPTVNINNCEFVVLHSLSFTNVVSSLNFFVSCIKWNCDL